jgi:hypothetical protein
MKVEMGKKYTSNGNAIRILCVDRPYSKYPVVGVRDDGCIMYFTEDGYYTHCDDDDDDSCEYYNKYNLIEVWEPQEGEWCWFFDEGSNHANIRKYSRMRGGCFISTDGLAWEHCSKFIGELPNHLKNIKNGETK